MDKETLSKYGWVVIVIIVLVILMSFAAPFGQYFYDSTMAAVESFGEMSNINKLLGNTNADDDADDAEVITNYTIEEINADNMLFMIGATKPEYVVARLNSDYTEVTITKNGVDSDGLMMSWPYGEDMLACDLPTLTRATVKEGVVSVGDYAFAFCDNLTDVILPDSINTIGACSFRGSKSLKNITFGNNVTIIGKNAFYGCSSLVNIIIPNNITTIDDKAFSYCVNLEEIVLGTKLAKIGSRSFEHCEALKQIKIPDSVTEIGDWAFLDCYNLTEMTILGNPEISDIAFDNHLEKLYGKANSSVESYAKTHEITFINI